MDNIPAWIIEEEKKRREQEWQPEPLPLQLPLPYDTSLPNSASIDAPSFSPIIIEL